MKTVVCTFVGAAFLLSEIILAQTTAPTTPPEGTKPLSGQQIRSLLGGGTNFSFVAVGAPITGTGYWNLETGTAYGVFVLGKKIKGNWGFEWFVAGNKNCLKYSVLKTVCTHIYPHGDGGFMEVNLDGTVHTIYTPVVEPSLPVDVTADEVERLLSRFLIWNQQQDVSVGSVQAEGKNLIAQFIYRNGTPAWTLKIDRKTGKARSK